MKSENPVAKKVRAVVAIVLVALYAIGLVAMLASRVQLALILWVISTLGGIGLLYWIHTMNKREEEAQKADSEAPEPED